MSVKCKLVPTLFKWGACFLLAIVSTNSFAQSFQVQMSGFSGAAGYIPFSYTVYGPYGPGGSNGSFTYPFANFTVPAVPTSFSIEFHNGVTSCQIFGTVSNPSSYCTTGVGGGPTASCGGGGNTAGINLSVSPIIAFEAGTSPSDSYCEYEEITLVGSPNYVGYHWQYRIELGPWLEFHSGLENSVTFSIQDILGPSYEDHLNKSIFFSYSVGNCLNGVAVGPFTFRPIPPTITASAENPVCHNGTGTLTVSNFSRNPKFPEVFDLKYRNANDPTDGELLMGNITIADLPQVFTGRAEGEYEVYIESMRPNPNDPGGFISTGCGDPQVVPIEIIIPSQVTLSNQSSTSPTCHTSTTGTKNDGTITVTAAGGSVTGFMFSKDDGNTYQASNVFTGLTIGSYPIKAKDSNGCETLSATEVMVGNPLADVPPNITVNTPAVTSNYNSRHINCVGSNDGQITITASSTRTLDYSIDNGNTFQASNVFNELAAGDYSIIVRDNGNGVNFCSKTSSVVSVISPPAITVSGSSTPTTCFGSSNGSSINVVNPAGGTGGYDFSLDGVNFQSGTSFPNQPVGNYTITVRDANLCTATSSVIAVTSPPAITVSGSSTPTTCIGLSNGSIQVENPAGGTGTLSFSLDAVNFQASTLFTNRPAGSYTITARDANLCTATSSVVLVTSPTAITVFASSTPISCFGLTNGTVQAVNPTGGTGALSFSLDAVNFQTGTLFTNQSVGNYTITVRDANLCTATSSVVSVTSPSAITFSTSSTPTSCFGFSDGTVEAVDPTGGTGTLNFSLDAINFQDDNLFANRLAGDYTITVRDGNLCTATSSVVSVTSPPAITALATSTPTTCFGFSDGTIRVENPAGGTGALNFSLDAVNFQAAALFTNRPAGDYTITVRDATSCAITINKTITQPPAIDVTATPTLVSCSGGNNGTVTLLASNTQGTVSYSLDGGTLQPSSVFTDLLAANHSYLVQDGNGCARTGNVEVDSNPVITGPIAITTSISCNEGSNGALNLTPGGGVGPYTFAWSNGATTEDISGLSVGTYSVTITDSENCQRNFNRGLTQPQPISVNYSTSNYNGAEVSCFGANDGFVNITSSGGNGGFTFVWSNGSTTEDLIGLPAGSYSVTVTDSKSCTGNETIFITEPDELITTFSDTQNIACHGDNTGSITVTSAGGITNYEYSINSGANWQTSPLFTNLSATDYTILTRDENGCSDSDDVTLTSPADLVININSITNTVCGQPNGSASISASGGVSSYSFTWLNNSDVLIGSNNEINNLPAGIYTIVVTDQNLCSKEQTIPISSSSGPVIELEEVMTATCSYTADGSATINITAGEAPYSILWPNSQTTATATNLVGGDHFVEVRDNADCLAIKVVTVPAPSELAIEVLNQQNPNCMEDANGVIEISAAGGNGNYTYSWNNNSTSTSISNLVAGTYTVTVKDYKDCQAVHQVTLTDPPSLSIDVLNQQEPNCLGNADGLIVISAAGGNGNYTYSWSNGSTSSSINNLIAGTYTVTVNDVKDCQAIHQVTLTDPPVLTIEVLNQQDPSCLGDANGMIEISGAGGNGNYSYDWGDELTSTLISNLTEGTYTVTVKDVKYCQTLQEIILSDPPALTIDVLNQQDPDCQGDANGMIEIAAAGGNGNYVYSWSNESTNPSISNLIAGTYTLTIKDVKNCQAVHEVILSDPPALTIEILNQQNPNCLGNANGLIEISAEGGNGNYVYSWSNGSTSALVNNLLAGSYTVTVKDVKNCETVQQITLTEPPLFAIDLGTDQKICEGQTIIKQVDVANATYSWTGPNNFISTQQQVSLIKAGIYTLTVINQNGCEATDSFELLFDPTLLKADFLMVSEASVGEAIMVIDISWPLPSSVSWQFDPAAVILKASQDFSIIRFDDPGEYEISMTAHLAQCESVHSQVISIVENPNGKVGGRIGSENIIRLLHVFPNPTTDRVTVEIELSEKNQVTVELYHMQSNRREYTQVFTDNSFYRQDFKIGHLLSGLYVVVVKVGNEMKSVRVIKL